MFEKHQQALSPSLSSPPMTSAPLCSLLFLYNCFEFTSDYLLQMTCTSIYRGSEMLDSPEAVKFVQRIEVTSKEGKNQLSSYFLIEPRQLAQMTYLFLVNRLWIFLLEPSVEARFHLARLAQRIMFSTHVFIWLWLSISHVCLPYFTPHWCSHSL